jgi:hypothetical protein
LHAITHHHIFIDFLTTAFNPFHITLFLFPDELISQPVIQLSLCFISCILKPYSFSHVFHILPNYPRYTDFYQVAHHWSSATSVTDSLKIFNFCKSLWFDFTSTVSSSIEFYLSQLASHYYLIVPLLISASG